MSESMMSLSRCGHAVQQGPHTYTYLARVLVVCEFSNSFCLLIRRELLLHSNMFDLSTHAVLGSWFARLVYGPCSTITSNRVKTIRTEQNSCLTDFFPAVRGQGVSKNLSVALGGRRCSVGWVGVCCGASAIMVRAANPISSHPLHGD